MNLDDMILVSIDDHVIEPPDMFEGHVPQKWADQAPKVERSPEGIDRWVFQGIETSTPFGMCAVVTWPKEEWGFNPGVFSEIRPACYDVNLRVRDMDAGGVLASMNFPTMAGFNARTFCEADDKDLALIMLKAYNDWHIDEWCGSHPGRFIPIGIVPMWDPELCAAEVRRLADKGCKAISFLEAPHAFGFPSFHNEHWDPMLTAMSETGSVLCMHIGASGGLITLAPDAPVDHHIILPTQLTLMALQDIMFGRTLRKFPDLRIALSEGGIGWIPYYLERADRHAKNQLWIGQDWSDRMPSQIFRDQILACFITDPAGVKLRNEIGIDNLAWECDYPHTDSTWPNGPEQLFGEFTAAGATDDEINKITHENSCRFFDFDPFKHTAKKDATVGALRARATDVDLSTVSKAEYRARAEAAGRETVQV
ncbi:amidohydrolase [Mycobacterium paraffinicum]|uniref:Amidohydrolase n=1 Tax=Mycobacterium paraffinicum TaxID=53378 RepID=A0A1Q4I2I4_9MYCO|nr:amidohydrolase family protein [Mycobacterium paraffinicum]OJZ76181.1 amidohydrolase [Mycobacterium paraffinicum]